MVDQPLSPSGHPPSRGRIAKGVTSIPVRMEQVVDGRSVPEGSLYCKKFEVSDDPKPPSNGVRLCQDFFVQGDHSVGSL